MPSHDAPGPERKNRRSRQGRVADELARCQSLLTQSKQAGVTIDPADAAIVRDAHCALK